MRLPKTLENLDQLSLGPWSLVFFIDDTGDETRTDKSQPFFGMGGCGVLGKDVDALITKPWREVRRVITGFPETPLHAAKMRPPFPREHTDAVSSFFAANGFMRFGVSCDTTLNTFSSIELTRVLLMSLQRRLNSFLRWCWTTDVVVIFEHSERLEEGIKQGFDSFLPTQFGSVRPWTPCFMPKWANQPGLEVADFIAHAVGGQARAAKQFGRGSYRKDFEAVFASVEPHLRSYFHIREIRYQDHFSPSQPAT